MDNVLVAYDEKQSVVENFRWKGYATNSLEQLDEAMDEVEKDIYEFQVLYQEYQDAPVVSSKAYSKNYKDMDFAKVEDLSAWQFEKNTLSETGEASAVQTKRLYHIAESLIQTVSDLM